MASDRLRISRIELSCEERVYSAKLTINGQRHILSRQSDVLCADFNPVLETASDGPFSLSVKYTSILPSILRRPQKVEFKPSEVLVKSQNNEFHEVSAKLGIVLRLSPESSQEVASTPVDLEPLPPTIEGILQQCPRFRVLVIGKSGVGKSTLINHTFGIKNAFPEHDKRGRADITKGLISKQNGRFILHDSKGFESGEDDTLTVVTKFIKERRNNEDIKEQLHAVWLCFQIPNTEAGQRMMETGMEEFLQQKKEILGDVPTIFVFTKYDVLTTAVEEGLMESVKDYTSVDVELKAKQLVEERCVEPVKKLTKETSIPHIAVSTAHRDTLGGLIQLTYQLVSEYFGNQPGIGTSVVPTVAVMAQRVAPDLKIEGAIKVGKERYWQAIFTGRVFFGHSVQDCLQVIHDDIIGVWNFRDDDKLLLSKEFREFMMNLVNLLDRPMDCPPPQRSETTSSMQKEGIPLVVFWMFALPFAAGLKLVKWAHNIYQQTPEMQQKFIAYIADLTNVLDILFTLTASRNEDNLNIRAIKAAYKAYYGSMRRMQVHTKIRGCPLSMIESSGVISETESLVRQRYVIDEALTKKIGEVSAGDLEGKEPWYP